MKTKTVMPIIGLTQAEKGYEGGGQTFWALKGVDLNIERGQLAAVVGKSGSGKSTLLNLLGGIDTPTRGSVRVNGEELGGLSESRLTRFRGENIGFVFQFFQLMPTLTVLENVRMPMDFLNRIPAAQRTARGIDLLARVGMDIHRDKYPSALSGGEQQRVAIARALANDPPIILADEPTGNLDSGTAEDVFQVLKALAAEGKTVIMVTHDDDLAKRCGRVIRISDGLVISDEHRKAGEDAS